MNKFSSDIIGNQISKPERNTNYAYTTDISLEFSLNWTVV